jgi:hypothetical protein
VDAMRREVLSAADLICWELRTAAVRTRAGNANIAFPAPLINRVVFHRVIALEPTKTLYADNLVRPSERPRFQS